MTDQTSPGDATDDAETPRRARPWSRTKALTVLIAAWAVLGLLTVAVLLGSVAVSGLLAEGRTDGHRLLIHIGIIGLATIIATLAVPLLWSTIVPTPKDDEDYGSTDITPLAVSLPGLLLPPAICLLGEWFLDGTGLPLTTLMTANMMLAYRHLTINKQLGPIFKSRSPELWAEALDRRGRQKAREKNLHRWLGPLIVIPPVLLIFFIIAKAVFGD